MSHTDPASGQMPADAFIEPIVAHHFPDKRLLSATRLTGGVSADVYRLDLQWTKTSRELLVLRIHGETHGGLGAALEFSLLEGLHAAGAPVARPVLADTSGTVCPHHFLVTTFVTGTTALPGAQLTARIAAMAQTLDAIHGLAIEGLPDLPDRLDPRPELLSWLGNEGGLDPTGAYRKTIAALGETRYTGPRTLLHGDFWPENIVWQGGSIATVLDWEDAAFGDPVSDVACTSLELRYLFGKAAMDAFLSACRERRPVDPARFMLWLAYVSAGAMRYMGDWGLPPEREARMRREARAALAEAMDALAG